MSIPHVAAVVFLLLTCVVVVFQAALLFGAPWGELTLGGRYRGRLPGRARMLPVVSLVLLAGFAIIVLARAGLVLPDWARVSRTLIWIVVGYCVLGVLANAATPSRRERRLWLPVVSGMLLASVAVALA